MFKTANRKYFARKTCRSAIGFLITASTFADLASAAEVSLISGLYRKEDAQVNDNDAGGEQRINVGGRFMDKFDTHMYWLAQGSLTLRSYDAPKGGEAPSNSTSLNAGGGVRYYFAKLTENTSTFAQGVASYKSTKDADITSSGYSEKETSGLYYSGSLGFRINCDRDFFFDFEAPLFESALFATEKTKETTNATGTTPKTTTETEREKTELYVDTAGAFTSVTVGFGMKL